MPGDLPHTSMEPFVTAILELAHGLGHPAVTLPAQSLGQGEQAGGVFVAGAGRVRLAEAIGVLVVMTHQTRRERRGA